MTVERTPLFVDLDGTLVATDTLHESLVRLVVERPLTALRAPLWLARGRAEFKQQIAAAVDLDPSALPYRVEVLDLIRNAKAEGRRVVLATGAPRRIAERIAAHVGLFDDVLATDGTTNLTGKRKLAAVEHSAGGPFDYVGNGGVDIPIWARSRSALTVGLGSTTTRTLGRHKSDATTVVPSRGLGFGTLVRALRVTHWAKNLLLFIPVFTAHLLSLDPLLTAALGFAAFSALASAIYLINDIVDLPNDRAHPIKRNRPIASGELSIAAAMALAAGLVAIAFVISLRLPAEFRWYLGAYVVTTTAYSIRLKRVVALDTIVLTMLYALRIGAGAATVGVEVSPWLFVFSLFLFMSLALIKRASEILGLDDRKLDRAKGRDYRRTDLEAVAGIGTACSAAAVLVFALYVNASPEVAAGYRNPDLLYGVCPILLYWLARAWILARRGEITEDPIVFAIKDRATYLSVALIGLLMVLAL